MKNKPLFFVLFSLVFLVALFYLGSIFVKKEEQNHLTQQIKNSKDLIYSDAAIRKGSATAQIVVTEFFDPECESCREFYPYLQSFLHDYDGKIQLVLRYAPFHPNSIFAIKILEAAREQNLYWETLQLLYKHQPEWGSHQNPRPELIWTYLKTLKLDLDKLKKDMESARIKNLIEKDTQALKLLGVKATPTFFVNDQIVSEYGPMYLRSAIEEALKQTAN